MAAEVIETPVKRRRNSPKKAAVEAALAAPVETTEVAVPAPADDVAPLAPLGTVIANISVELGAFISFDAAVRGAIMDNKSEGFKNLHQHEDGSVTPVRQQYVCPACDATSGFVKGRASGDSYVVIPPEVVAAHNEADAAHDKKLTLQASAVADVYGALPNGKVYYLAPSKKTNSHYANLAALLDYRRDVAFTGVLAMKGIAYRYLLTSDGKTVTLNQLADPEFVRARPEANVEANHNVQGLSALVDQMITPFVAQQRTSKRSAVVEEYVASAAPAAVLTAEGEVKANGSGDLDSMLAAAAEKAGIVLPFPAKTA